MNESRTAACVGITALASVAVAALAVQGVATPSSAEVQPGAAPSLAAHGAGVPAARRDDARPNILYIVTDDEAISDFTRQSMPNTYRFLVDGGTVYSNS